MNKALKSQLLAVSETPEFARLLAIGIHQLTVYARAYREPSATKEESLLRLKITNELIHQLSSKLRSQLDGTPAYPNEVFVEILIETAAHGCSSELDRAFQFALEQLSSHPIA